MSFSPLDSALLGPLFRTEAMAEIFSDRARLAAMLRAEEVLARVQAEAGLVPIALAEQLAKLNPTDFDLVQLGHETARAGVPVIPFVKAVQARLPHELEPYFHFGATTQDIADTALALQMREAFCLIAEDLAHLLASMSQLAREHESTACIGRTYLQHAAPVTFGFKIATRMANILAFAQRLKPLCDQSLLASLSGPVGTLSALSDQAPQILTDFAKELNLACPLISMHTQRGPMAGIGAWLAGLCDALGAWGSDIIHLASTEVGEVSEPHLPGRGGSSAMPHKRNPVSGTILVAAATTAPGLASTLFSAMLAHHERPAGAWHTEWHVLPQLFGLVSGALREARVLADGLVVNTERMRRNIEMTRGLIFADAASAALVPTRGRNQAHELVERAADHARTSEITLCDALLLENLTPDERAAVEAAFGLEHAIKAAAQWVRPVCERADQVRASLIEFTKEA